MDFEPLSLWLKFSTFCVVVWKSAHQQISAFNLSAKSDAFPNCSLWGLSTDSYGLKSQVTIVGYKYTKMIHMSFTRMNMRTRTRKISRKLSNKFSPLLVARSILGIALLLFLYVEQKFCLQFQASSVSVVTHLGIVHVTSSVLGSICAFIFHHLRQNGWWVISQEARSTLPLPENLLWQQIQTILGRMVT